MADLKVRWRGAVYEIATCLNDERAAEAAAQWPEGVIDIATMLDPGRKDAFSELERRQLAHMVLSGLGERTLAVNASPETMGKPNPRPAPVGAGRTVLSRPIQHRKIDHAYLQELAADAGPKTVRVQLGAAIRKLEASSAPSSSSSSSSSSSAGGDGGVS